MTEEERFRQEIRNSSKEVWRLDLAFHRPGIWVEWKFPKIRPSYALRHGYGDTYDYTVCFEDGRRPKLELKYREELTLYSSRAFPFATINVDRANKADKNLSILSAYITFNKTDAALILVNTYKYWVRELDGDAKKRYGDYKYLLYRCPKQHAAFGSLLHIADTFISAYNALTTGASTASAARMVRREILRPVLLSNCVKHAQPKTVGRAQSAASNVGAWT